MATKKPKRPARKAAQAKSKSSPKAKQTKEAQAEAKAKPKAKPKSAPHRGSKGGAKAVRSKPETLRLRQASPSFTVNDVEKSLAWYRDVAGFTAGERWERDGKLLGVEMKAGDVVFMLGQDDWAKGRDRVKGVGFRTWCTTVQDVDVLAAGIKARGGTLDTEPEDHPWGWRDFSFTDPDGFKISIGVELKKPRK